MAHIVGTNTGAALTLLTESGASCVLGAGAFTAYLNASDLVALQRSGLLDQLVSNGRCTSIGVSYDDGPTLASSLDTIDGLTVSKLIDVGPIAAKGAATAVHALYDGAVAAFPGPFTSPASPRNLIVTKSASWDGGTITVTGTDQFDAVISELFNADVEATVGVKAFKTVTGAVKSIPAGVAGNGASIGAGDTIGLPVHLGDEIGLLSVAGVLEAVTLDDTYDTFIPTTTPSATTYRLLINYNP